MSLYHSVSFGQEEMFSLEQLRRDSMTGCGMTSASSPLAWEGIIKFLAHLVGAVCMPGRLHFEKYSIPLANLMSCQLSKGFRGL
jgi:hypothetical protein